jgi:hypothetical protein
VLPKIEPPREKQERPTKRECEVDHEQDDDAERLKELIAEVNRKALSDDLTSREVDLIREMLPHLKDMIEERNRRQWLKTRHQWFVKRIWAFLLAIPALLGSWQVVTKIVEWFRGQ